MIMMKMRIIMMMITAVTQPILKLGPPDFAKTTNNDKVLSDFSHLLDRGKSV